MAIVADRAGLHFQLYQPRQFFVNFEVANVRYGPQGSPTGISAIISEAESTSIKLASSIGDIDKVCYTCWAIQAERNPHLPDTAEKILFCRENLPRVNFKYKSCKDFPVSFMS